MTIPKINQDQTGSLKASADVISIDRTSLACAVILIILAMAFLLVSPAGQMPFECSLLLVIAFLLAAWSVPHWIIMTGPALFLCVLTAQEILQTGQPIQSVIRYFLRLLMTSIAVFATCSIRQRLEKALQTARIDALTGLPNRTAILEALDGELCRARRFARPFALAMIDCDGFKLINDTHGHLAGDQVLQKIGDVMRKQIRAYDRIGRLGGDEFVLILPETIRKDVAPILERLRAALRQEFHDDYPLLSFSIGVSVFLADQSRGEFNFDQKTCLQKADEAMYIAKRAGRDHTHFVTLGQELPQSQLG